MSPHRSFLRRSLRKGATAWRSRRPSVVDGTPNAFLGILISHALDHKNIRDVDWEKPDFDGSIVATAASSLVSVKTRISLTIALSNARKQDTAVVKSGGRSLSLGTKGIRPIVFNSITSGGARWRVGPSVPVKIWRFLILSTRDVDALSTQNIVKEIYVR
jgi:hypothetical protein